MKRETGERRVMDQNMWADNNNVSKCLTSQQNLKKDTIEESDRGLGWLNRS